MRRNLAFLGLGVFFLSSAAGAQVVKCTDAEGKVTYTDLPCLRAEKTTVVDTRAASNVMDHTFIRAQKGRLATPETLPPVPVTYLSPPITPPSPSASTSSTQTSRAVYTPF